MKNNFETMPESDDKSKLQADFLRWKTGDLTGIIGQVFKYLDKDDFTTSTIEVKEIGNMIKTGIPGGSAWSGSSSFGREPFIRLMDSGYIVPMGLDQEVTTKDGGKAVVGVKLTPKQKEESDKDDQQAARDGYFNEKPSDILNVGKDVWGARRHDYVMFRNSTTLKVKVPVENKKFTLAKAIAEKSKESFQSQFKDLVERAGADSLIVQLIQGNESYYTRNCEAFARAFECYIADKLDGQNRQNTYLASVRTTTVGNGSIVYPQGEDRSDINALFDKFFDELRESGDLKKALDLFSKNHIVKRLNPKTGLFEYSKAVK